MLWDKRSKNLKPRAYPSYTPSMNGTPGNCTHIHPFMLRTALEKWKGTGTLIRQLGTVTETQAQDQTGNAEAVGQQRNPLHHLEEQRLTLTLSLFLRSNTPNL